MIEVKYGDHSEQVNLASRSVAEIREQYHETFDIPRKAVAVVNGKEVKRKLEPETMLNENDELYFEIKKGSRKPLLIGALLLALALTGGLFAWTYTTATVTVTPTTSGSDWAGLESSENVTWTCVTGKYRGTVGSGSLFKIQTDNCTAADFVVDVFLTNTDELVQCYRALNMKMQITPSATTSGNCSDERYFGTDGFELLTLNNDHVSFTVSGSTDATHYVYLAGGNYVTNAWGWGSSCSYLAPTFYCDIEHK